MRKFIRTLTCLCVITACGTAFAGPSKLQSGPYKGPMGPIVAPDKADIPDAVIFTNLANDPCNPGFKYSPANGFLVLGPNNCGIAGATQWLAEPFTAKVSQAVTRVMLSVTNWGICTPTSTRFTVQIYDDACLGIPNNPLGSPITANAPAAPPSLASANFGATGPLLTAGVQYWVVVTTSPAVSQNGTTAVWWQALSGNEPFNLNDGNGWQQGNLGGPGGFQVQ